MLRSRKHALTKADEKALVRRPVAEAMDRPTPSDWMRRFSEDMDRWFGTWGPREMWPFSGRSLTWMPDVDVIERQGGVVVRVDVPGIDRKDLKVEVTESAVTIEGDRTDGEEQRTVGYYRSERRHGHFSRTIVLPEGADPDHAEASFRNGVLEVLIPTPGRAARHRVEIKDAE